MKPASTLKSIVAAVLLMGAASANAQLQARYFDNDNVIDGLYDSVLDITWLADFNYVGTLANNTATGGYLSDANARSWALSLDFNGIDDWRLPDVMPVNGSSFNRTFSTNGSTDEGFANVGVGWMGTGGPASELGHLFYVSLGNSAMPGGNSAVALNTGSFRNLIKETYRSGPLYDPINQPGYGWDFDFWDGSQDSIAPGISLRAVAVHDGMVGSISPVPEPGTYAMMLAGLALIVPMARRRAAARLKR